MQRCKRYTFKAVIEFFVVLMVFFLHIFVLGFVLSSAVWQHPSSTSHHHHITAADDDGKSRASKADHVAISLQDVISILYKSGRILAVNNKLSPSR